MQALFRGKFFSWYPCTVFIAMGLYVILAFKASQSWNRVRAVTPSFCWERLQLLSLYLALSIGDFNYMSEHRWDLQRPHRRSWILLSSKSIGSSGLENDCNEGKVMVIRKLLEGHILCFWWHEAGNYSQNSGELDSYRKNWKTQIIWVAVMRRSARSRA